MGDERWEMGDWEKAVEMWRFKTEREGTMSEITGREEAGRPQDDDAVPQTLSH
jgi:hypothetical protein